MDIRTKQIIFLLRIALGILFLYAGVSKIIDPDWSAAGYLKGAKTFSALYQWFASPENIGWVNILNEWGAVLIGLGLLFGVATRVASIAGILLMLLYYLPILRFPYAGEHAFLIDEHVVYILLFALFIASKAGHMWGLDPFLEKKLRHSPQT